MKDMFSKFVPWKIMRFLCLNPTTEVYVQELSRKLHLSAGMCSSVLKELEASGMVSSRELGKAHYYKLSDNYLTRALKQLVISHLISTSGLVDGLRELHPGALSVVLYGSYAHGDYMEGSDMDILIIGPGGGRTAAGSTRTEKELGIEVNVMVIGTGQWSQMGRKGDPFYQEVMNGHIVLDGGALP